LNDQIEEIKEGDIIGSINAQIPDSNLSKYNKK
jgi:hypothetical protein